MKRRPLPYYESSLHSKPLVVLVLALIFTIGIIPSLFATSTLPLFSVTGTTPVVTPPPSVGITLDTYALTVGQTATVTFTFPAPPSTFTLSDITAPNGTVSNLTVTADPRIYTAIYHPNPGVTDFTNAISLAPMVVMNNYALPTGTRPVGIAFDGANMWTANSGTNGFSKIPISGGPVTSWSHVTGDLPRDIAFDGTNMWIPNYTNANVTKVAPDGTTITSSGTAQPGGDNIAFDGTHMWVTNPYNNTVTERDPVTANRIGPVIDLTPSSGPGPIPHGIAFDGANMWTANSGTNGFSKIPISGGPVTSWSHVTGQSPVHFAFDGSALWTANAADNSVSRIAPDGTVTTYSAIQKSGSIGSGLTNIAFDGTNLWTTNGRDKTVIEINDLSGVPGSIIGIYPMTQGIAAVGLQPGAIAFDGTNMWTVDTSQDSVTKIFFTAASSSANYTVTTDTNISIVLDNYALLTGTTAQVTFTFPTPPAHFTLADVSASNGTLSNLVSTADPRIYTATFTPLPGIIASTNEISVNGSVAVGVFPDIGNDPRSIAFDGTNMWVANYADNSVTKVAPNGTATDYSGTGLNPSAIAFDGTNMWTANNGDASVSKIAPNGVITTYSGTGANPGGIAFDGTNMWTADIIGNSVTKVAPDGTMRTFTGIGSNPRSLAFDGTNMWTINTGDNSVSKIAPDGTATVYFGVGINPHSIAFDGTNMWVASVGNSSVSKIAPDGTITSFTASGGTPASIVFDGTNMWTANPGNNSITEVFLDGTMTTFGGLPADPSAIAYDGTNLWTANGSSNSVLKITPTPASASANYTINTTTSTGGVSNGGSGGSGGGGGGGGRHGGPLQPGLQEVVPVPSPTSNTTPSYTFSTTESGNMIYSGGCSSSTEFVGAGSNTITFHALENGLHNTCIVQEIDGAGRLSNILRVSPFVIDAPVPPAPATPVGTHPSVPSSLPKTPKTPTPESPVETATSTASDVAPVQTPSVPSNPIPAVVPVVAVPEQPVPAPVVVPQCSYPTSSNAFGMIANEISWRYCMTVPSIESAFERIKNAYMAKNGALISMVIAFIAILGAGFMVFSSGLFLDSLSAADILLVPGRIGELLLEGLGIQKRRASWGTVYDSATKAPLDPVRLELYAADGTKIASTLTSIDGGFRFPNLAPGNYTIRAQKDGYAFPSQKLAGMPHDEVYRTIYHGETFTITQAGGMVPLNIALEPINFEWKAFIANNGGLMKAYALGDRLVSHSTDVFLVAGTSATLLTFIMDPSLAAFTLLLAALLICIIRPKTLFARHFGYVKDSETSQPLSYGIVRIASETGQPLVDVVLSSTGRYFYQLPQGRYLVTIDRKMPNGDYQTVAKELPARSRGGYVSQNFSVASNSLRLIANMLPKL